MTDLAQPQPEILDFPILDVEEMLEMEDAEYLIEGVLPEKGLTIVFGAPGTYKSFLVFDQALHIAHGMPWQGRETRQVPVLYVAGESSWTFKARMQGWNQFHQLGGCPNFGFCGVAPDIRKGQLQNVVRRFIKKKHIQPKLVVIDTLHSTYGDGDESSSRDGGVWWAAIKQAIPDVAYLIVHHSGVEATRPRGTTAFHGSAEAMFKISSSGGKSMKVDCQKMKAGEGHFQLTFNLETVELPVNKQGKARTTLVVAPPPEEQSEGTGLSSKHLEFLSTIHAFGGRVATPFLLSQLAEWPNPPGQSTFYRWIDKLDSEGYLEYAQKGMLILTPKGRAVVVANACPPSAAC